MQPDHHTDISLNKTLSGTLSKFQAAIDMLQARAPSLAGALLKELPEIQAKGGFTPENVKNYFGRNLLRISTLAEIPGLLEEVISQSRDIINKNDAPESQKKIAANVIGNVVSEMGSKVPLDFRLQLIREVPDGQLLASVVKDFLYYENFHFSIPKDSSSLSRQGDWRASISDIPQADFERIIRALPDALPRLLATTHSLHADSPALTLSNEQMRVLGRITGNGNYEMRSVMPHGSTSHTISEIDKLQTGTFAQIAVGEDKQIPTSFKRDLAICSANMQLPNQASCELLSSYHSSHGPAHVLALWLAMRPENAFNNVILSFVHFSLSKFAKSGNEEAFSRFCSKLEVDSDQMAKIFREAVSASGSNTIEPAMKALHAAFNPASIASSFSRSFTDFRERRDADALKLAKNAIALEHQQPFKTAVTSEIAQSLSTAISINELKSILIKARQDQQITDEQLPALAIESLTKLFERQNAGVTQILYLPRGKFDSPTIPRSMHLASIEDLAHFIVGTNCEALAKQDRELHDSFLRYTLTMLSPEIDSIAKPSARSLLDTVKILGMGQAILESNVGQQMLGTVVGQVLINGDMKIAKDFLQYRKPNIQPGSIDLFQLSFDQSIPRILSCELSGAGYGRMSPNQPHNLEKYKEIGLEISEEQLRRAIVRQLRPMIHSTSISDRHYDRESIISFCQRFKIPSKTLKAEIDRRIAKQEVHPRNYEAIYNLAKELGLSEDPATKIHVFKDRRFKEAVAEKLKFVFQDLKNHSKFIVNEELASKWNSLSLIEKVKSLVDPKLSEIINAYSLNEEQITSAAKAAYKELANATGKIAAKGEDALEKSIDSNLARLERMQFLAKHFGIKEEEAAHIDQQAALAKLPRISTGIYESSLFELRMPNYPYDLDNLTALDSLRQHLSNITHDTLANIDLCKRNNLPAVQLNNQIEVIAAVGTIASVVTAEILNQESDKNLVDYIRNQVLARATQSLGLPKTVCKQALEYAIIMSTQAVINEESTEIRASDEELDVVRQRIELVKSSFKLNPNEGLSIDSLWKELEKLYS